MRKPQLLLFIFFSSLLVFYWQCLFLGKLPIPADTIVGLYHPFRDFYAKDYPNGIPFKNFLITDPVRQTYPWRFVSVALEKSGQLPLWNAYNAAGTPLLATIQSAPFYPLNIFLFLLPFSIGWSFLIFLQQLLAGIFLFYYLKNLKLHDYASFFGAFVYSFCGFFIAWLEWGTMGHVALWLPLILLCIDKIFLSLRETKKRDNPVAFRVGLLRRFTLLNERIFWPLLFLLALTSSFFAGHLQIFFYLYLITAIYFLVRWFQQRRDGHIFLLFLILNFSFLIITFVQWFPTLQFILASARNVDQMNWHQEGWFIPWQHLIQFIAPDFFGNPRTLNYWGVWNYGEFVGYVGILPLITGLFALFYRYDKKTFFFGTVFFCSLIFSLPTFFAELPYIFHIPFLATSQPTRLIFLTDFSLSILAALGFDMVIRGYHKKKILYPFLVVGIVLLALWSFVFFGAKAFSLTQMNMDTAKHNLVFPTVLYGLSLFFFLILLTSVSKRTKGKNIVIIILIFITFFDLLRFSDKFIPFTNKAYLFPSTNALTYVQQQKGVFRIMTTDSRILPPNFSLMYHLQSLDTYDPLYLKRYGEFISAMERNKPDIQPPFGFNRIINPHNINSRLIDLLGVQYVLSLSDINDSKFKKVYTEGQTKVYQNMEAFPRVFFVKKIIAVSSKEESIKKLFDNSLDLRNTAVVEEYPKNIFLNNFVIGNATISQYSENKIVVQIENQEQGFLVLMDSFYPTWHAQICSQDNINCRETMIYKTNFNFRGVIVPPGKKQIIFYNSLL
jgi:hypothetical protein